MGDLQQRCKCGNGRAGIVDSRLRWGRADYRQQLPDYCSITRKHVSICLWQVSWLV